MKPVSNNEAERAAELWNAQADQYNQWSELGADEKEAWIAKCAAPVVADDGLPPLPDDYYMLAAPGRKVYDEDHMRQYARDAIAADRAARAQQQAQSVGDSVDFQALLSDVMVASKTGQSVTVVAEKVQALIAYIDGRTAGAAPEGFDLDALIDECREAVQWWEPLRQFIDKYVLPPLPLNMERREAIERLQPTILCRLPQQRGGHHLQPAH